MPKRKAPKRKAPKQGKGLLDAFKKITGVVKKLSDVTGIKPSALLASSPYGANPAGAIGASLLASQGLGKRKRKAKPKKGGNFFDTLFSPATALLGAVGNTAGNVLGSVLGSGVTKAGRGRRVGMGRRSVVGGSCQGFPGVSDASASVVKF